MNGTIRTAALVAAALAAWCASAPAQETRMIFATVTAPTSPMAAQVLKPWAERVNEQGKGALALDIREGFTLANYGNVYTRVMDDVVGAAFALQAPIGGKFQLSEVAGLPYISETAEQASVALWRLYKTGMMAGEYGEIVPVMLSAIAQSGLHLNKAPSSIDDLRGLKVMADGKVQNQVVSVIGATPISLQINEVYEAIQRGVLDGVQVAWTAFPTFKLAEVTHYHIDTRLGTSTAMVFMAKKKYDQLPAAARQVIDANSGEAESRKFGQYWDRQNSGTRERVKAEGKHQIVTLTPEQTRQWQSRVQPAIEDWKTRTNGAAVLEKYRALLEEVKRGS
jgi:TRAP-type C4-dicarboxylate transport system substrate-binding protein